MCVCVCVVMRSMLCSTWRGAGAESPVGECRAGGCQGWRSQGQDQPPPPAPGGSAGSPGPSLAVFLRAAAEAACSGSTQRVSGSRHLVAGHGFYPRGHAASILIKLGCHAGKINQGAPCRPLFWSRRCSGAVPAAPGWPTAPQAVAGESRAWHLLQRKLRSGGLHPGRGSASACGMLPFAHCRWGG